MGLGFLTIGLLFSLPFLFPFGLFIFLLFEPTLMKSKRANRVTEALMVIVFHIYQALLLLKE